MNTLLNRRRRALYGRATIAALCLLCAVAGGFLGGISLSGCATAAHATPAITHSAATLASQAVAITPSDSVNVPGSQCAGVWTGTGGSIEVVDQAGNDTTFASVPAGAILPVMAVKVKAAGTTATGLIALY